MPPSVSQDTLNQISRSLEQPSGFHDMVDLMQNHQVRCIFCNREIGWNRSQAKEHIENHQEFKDYRNRMRETNKIWFENAAKLYRLRKEQLSGILYEIQQVKDTLTMMETAEDTSFIVQALRSEQFQQAINENRLPADIRHNPLDLSDIPRSDQERQWYEAYLAENPDLKAQNIGFDDALRDLLRRRKAAKFA